MVDASRTRMPPVIGEIRSAAAISDPARHVAASSMNNWTLLGSSSPVMQFLRARRAAKRVGSPATNGTANATISLICSPASNDNAFSLATMASTRSAPLSSDASIETSATSDSGPAPADAWVAQDP
jgi:hypothetical protein